MAISAASVLGSRINGGYFDFSCIEFAMNGKTEVNVSEINYSDSMDPGIFRGSGAIPRGRTRGPYEAEGDFTMYKEDFEVIKGALAAMGLGGFMMASFGIAVHYRGFGEFTPITDTLEGCRIVRVENSHSQGNEALVVKCSLSIMRILHNGVPPVDVRGGGIAIL